MATQVLTALHRQLKAPAPVVGIVCDSAPACGSYANSYTAATSTFSAGFPLSILIKLVAGGVIALRQILIGLGVFEQPENLFRRTVGSELMHADLKGGGNRIVYVASRADRLVPLGDVLAHAEEMRRKGWRVKELVYEETAHCNHLARDEGAYLDVVRFVWERREGRGGAKI